jgi:hypothetical protein
MLSLIRTKLNKNKKVVLTRLSLFFTLAYLMLTPIANGGIKPSQTINIRDIGVPVCSVNWVRLHSGSTGRDEPWLYATMGQTADNLFVLKIHPETGQYHQFVADVPGSNFPTATLLARNGKLYIGAAYSGHLLCFDPVREVLSDLGVIHPGKATFPCRLDEDQKGRIWIGSYGTADLTC